MVLTELLAAFRRRWILVLVGVLLAGLVGVAVWQVTPQKQVVTARVMFLPPASMTVEDVNPLTQLGDLYPTASMMAVLLSDQEMTTRVESISAKAAVTAQQDPASSAPLLLLTVEDTDEARALRILDLMLGVVPSRLDTLQASVSVPKINRVTSQVLTRDSAGEGSGSDRLRAAIVAAAVVLLGTALVVPWIDGRWLRRSARRHVGGGPDHPRSGVSPIGDWEPSTAHHRLTDDSIQSQAGTTSPHERR